MRLINSKRFPAVLSIAFITSIILFFIYKKKLIDSFNESVALINIFVN